MSVKAVNGGTPTAFPWTTVVDENFDSATLGASTATLTNFGDAGNSTISNTQALSGAQSAELSVASGDTNWGYAYTPVTKILDGETIRLEVDMFYPTGFDFSAAPNVLKFIRFRQFTSADVHVGYIDLYMDLANNRFRTIVEGHVPALWTNIALTIPTTNTWHNFAFEATLGAVSQDLGGTGRMAIYKDGILQQEVTDKKILVASSNYVTEVHLHTFWNNGSPATQVCYSDNFKVTTR